MDQGGLAIYWNERATVKLGLSPGFCETQKEATALAFGMRFGRSSIPVRGALLFYALRCPQYQQVFLLNSDMLHFEQVSRTQ